MQAIRLEDWKHIFSFYTAIGQHEQRLAEKWAYSRRNTMPPLPLEVTYQFLHQALLVDRWTEEVG